MLPYSHNWSDNQIAFKMIEIAPQAHTFSVLRTIGRRPTRRVLQCPAIFRLQDGRRV